MIRRTAGLVVAGVIVVVSARSNMLARWSGRSAGPTGADAARERQQKDQEPERWRAASKAERPPRFVDVTSHDEEARNSAAALLPELRQLSPAQLEDRRAAEFTKVQSATATRYGLTGELHDEYVETMLDLRASLAVLRGLLDSEEITEAQWRQKDAQAMAVATRAVESLFSRAKLPAPDLGGFEGRGKALSAGAEHGN